MARIDRINCKSTNNNINVYSKRTCSDNSEMFITSKLDLLYRQAFTGRNLHASKRYLRKIVEGNNLDETV